MSRSKTSLTSKLPTRKAALYIRVSTHWQVDKDSLPLQREDLINYAKYALGIDKYEVFEDAGFSAKNTDRPAFQRMMSRLRAGEFTHLLVWKIDRISRNLLDFATMYAEIKKIGVTFVSKNEQFDTSSAMGEAMLKIILVFAELERNMTSERVIAVMLSRANNGQWNGGRIPYGYDYDKGTRTFSINETEAAVVKLIYDTYEADNSLVRVSRTLNDKGIRPRSGNPWTPTTVSIILKNPFYTGVYRYNYHDELASGGNSSTIHLKDKSEWIYIENHHPAIVSSERQNAIIAILEENRRTCRRSSKTYTRKHIHIFAGLMYCHYCGMQMQSTIDKIRADGYRPSIYACQQKRKFSSCPNKYVSDVTAGPFVLNYISNIMKAQENFGKSTPLATLERKLLRGTMFREVEHIEQTGLSELYEMLRRGKLSDTVYSPPIMQDTETNSMVADEHDLLASERRKKERALERLKTLYLYNDDAISERDYLVEKKSLTDEIIKIDTRLEEIERNSSNHFSISDEEFMAKASVFIMTAELKDKRFVDAEKLLRQIDKHVVKDFLNSVVQKIVVKDGLITSIRFKNGLEQKFLYNTDE